MGMTVDMVTKAAKLPNGLRTDLTMPVQTDAKTRPFRRYPELDGKTFLICVGAMKAATSWLYARLSETPGVAVSPLKEVQFFNARFPENGLIDADLLAVKRLAFHIDQSGNPVENLKANPAFRASVDRVRMIYDDDAYFEHFARLAEPETRVLTDITPAYAPIGEDGFRFMRQLCAGQDIAPKILFILRDPVDRLWSHLHFLRQFRAEFDPTRDWAEWLDDPATLARCDYKATIEALERVFPKDVILLLFYETLFDRGFADLCAHLNLSPPDIDKSRRANETRQKRDLPDEAAAAFRAVLDPQYAFCRDRFGGSLPPEWRE